ncbi:MAG: linoleoyl-CoA desaturase, partial [Sediminicola sp.]
MVVKTMVMLSLFFVPLVLLGSGMITSTLMLFAAYLVCG